MTRGRDANCWDMCAFPGPLRSVAEWLRVTCARPAGNAAVAGPPWGRKILPRRHQLPGGPRPFRTPKNPDFIGFFAMARGLLIHRAVKVRGRALRHLSEFCHAVCSWRRVVRAGRDPIADLVEIVVGASRPASARLDGLLRYPAAAAAAGSSTPASGSTGFSQISPATMSALLAAQSQSSTARPRSASTSPSSALQDLFSQIDTNGDGQITKSEFENALGAGGTNLAQADDVFNKLDTNGDGTVSLDELSTALKGTGGKGGHHHHHADGSGDASAAATEQHQRIEHRSAAAGAGRRIQQLGHQQRRLDHDLDHLCRRFEGDADDARRLDGFQFSATSSYNLHRADDAARGQAISSGATARFRSASEPVCNPLLQRAT